MNGRKGELKEEGQKRWGGGVNAGEGRVPSIHNALTAKKALRVSSSVRAEAQPLRGGFLLAVSPATHLRTHKHPREGSAAAGS